MADNTKIEWADATVNYVNGCSVISAGCTNCYAMRLAGTRLRNHPSRAGLTRDTKAGPVWTGEVRANESALLEPLRWKRPRRIFWNAHGDLFHENVPDAWIDRQFAVMALTPQHTHMVLTKRPERMREYVEAWYQRAGENWLADLGLPGRTDDILRIAPTAGVASYHALDNVPLSNVWLGTSVEDKRAADERIPHLLATPAAIRFLSCEPLLGPVDLTSIDLPGGWHECWPLGQHWLGRENVDDAGRPLPHIDWVIAGGESGPGARPMHPDWARSLRDQCAAAGVAFHFKQWGEWGPDQGTETFDTAKGRAQKTPAFLIKRDGTVHCFLPQDEQDAPVMLRIGKARAGRLLDGRTHDDFPGSQANA